MKLDMEYIPKDESESEEYKIINGNCLAELELIEKNSIDSIITDPPYELGFMGKSWDSSGIAFQSDTWKKCFDVLKSGGYLLAFGGSRTYHRIACAIEDAGFEIRDTIMWLYGSGFPKSLNIGLAIDKKNGIDNRTGIIKNDGNATNSGSGCYNCNNGKDNSMKREYEERIAQNKWKGWGTCLKPAFEPIIVARKPFKGTLVDNIIKYGVGGLNIDECRVESNKEDINKLNKQWDREWNTSYKSYAENVGGSAGFDYSKARAENKGLIGRFPANLILTYDETDYDDVCGGFPNTKSAKNGIRQSDGENVNCYGKGIGIKAGMNNGEYGDSGSASRYFYCAKASKKDRDEGLDEFENKKFYSNLNTKNGTGERLDGGKTPIRKNIHPTVKPTELMQYLIKLVTPKNGIILDPFMGSGSTGKAVMYENKERNANYKFIGIELDAEYCDIANARISYVKNLEIQEKI